MNMLHYVVTSTEFEVTFYMPYKEYSDILRYYTIGNELNAHECIQTHHKLIIF